MSKLPAIYRTKDPTLETAVFGAVYHIHFPDTGEPWILYKIADECGVSSIEPLEVPGGWDDTYEFSRADENIWDRIARLAGDAFLANANLEVSIVPVVDEGVIVSRALLYRFSWPY